MMKFIITFFCNIKYTSSTEIAGCISKLYISVYPTVSDRLKSFKDSESLESFSTAMSSFKDSSVKISLIILLASIFRKIHL